MPHSFELAPLGKALLGSVIGWERENSGQVAGGRTFALVCLSSAARTAFPMTAFPHASTGQP